MGARDLLRDLAGAGFSVTADGERLLIRPASMLTDDLRAVLRQAKPELLALLKDPAQRPLAPAWWGWDDAVTARFQSRRNRLLRWAWPQDDAEAMAERLARRDADADDRVSCAGDCAHYQLGRCGNHRRAGLNVPAIGRDWAGLLQRCPGHKESTS